MVERTGSSLFEGKPLPARPDGADHKGFYFTPYSAREKNCRRLELETAARGRKKPGRSWLMAGYAAWNAGDVEKSLRAFKHAVKYPKQKKSARKALRQLNMHR